jgi:hypothetical protein
MYFTCWGLQTLNIVNAMIWNLIQMSIKGGLFQIKLRTKNLERYIIIMRYNYICVLGLSCRTRHDWMNGYFLKSCDGNTLVCFMVFNDTFNNISVISRRSVLLVAETRVPGENHRPDASYWQTLSHNVVSSIHLTMNGFRPHKFSGNMHWLYRL